MDLLSFLLALSSYLVILLLLSGLEFIISTKCPTGPKEILLNGKGGLFFKIGNLVR